MGALGGNNNSVSVDFTGVKDSNFINLVDGQIYTGEITKVEQSVSKNGNNQLVWSFRVETEEGIANVRNWTVLKPEALFALKNLLKAIDPTMELDGPLNLDLNSFIGAKVRFIAKVDVNGDKVYNNVKTFLPPEAGEDLV
ncbi:MAG TPA: hypothetical protein ENG48_09310 [Candidatus Atribacteria bacterium]|nr:hypothetical protein [Candidatus Atribacteria bacterium]